MILKMITIGMPETEPHSPEIVETMHHKAKLLASLNQLIQEMHDVAHGDRPWTVSDVAADVLAKYCEMEAHEDPEVGRLLIDALEAPEGGWGFDPDRADRLRDWDLDLADRLRDQLGMAPVDRSAEPTGDTRLDTHEHEQ